MYTKISFIKNKIKNFLLKGFNIIENNGNPNFLNNGENYFVNAIFKSFKEIEKGKIVIFDIGANVGDYSQMLINYSKNENIEIDIHLFEPTKSCFDIIYNKFKNSEKLKLNNFGVSNSKTDAVIYYDKEKS